MFRKPALKGSRVTPIRNATNVFSLGLSTCLRKQRGSTLDAYPHTPCHIRLTVPLWLLAGPTPNCNERHLLCGIAGSFMASPLSRPFASPFHPCGSGWQRCTPKQSSTRTNVASGKRLSGFERLGRGLFVKALRIAAFVLAAARDARSTVALAGAVLYKSRPKPDDDN